MTRYLSLNDIHIPHRNINAHKGDSGKVLVIGGSSVYVGAPALAGLACLRAGCDWVTIAAPEKVAWAINTLSPDLITHKLKGKALSSSHIHELSSMLPFYDSLILGNGMGISASKKRLVRYLSSLPHPKVIDADALKMVRFQDCRNAILTPHAGELAILIKNS